MATFRAEIEARGKPIALPEAMAPNKRQKQHQHQLPLHLRPRMISYPCPCRVPAPAAGSLDIWLGLQLRLQVHLDVSWVQKQRPARDDERMEPMITSESL
eukprot:COSAG02_NODE_6217_length_3719_cov_3.158564_3_plen_100_part_00